MDSLQEISSLKATLALLREENERIKAKAQIYFNNSDLAFVVLDANQTIVEVNQVFEYLFGYPRKEIVGEPFSKLFTTPQLYQTWRLNYTQRESFEGASNLEFRLQKKSRIVFWVELFGKKFEDRGEMFTLWSMRDISLRVRSRNTIRNLNLKLQKQFEELEEIIDIIPLPIFIKDKQFRYIGCNKALCAFFNIEKSFLMYKMVYDLFPEKIASLYHEKDKEMLKESYQTYKMTFSSPVNGKERILEYHKKAIIREGEFEGIVGVVVDVTEQEAQEQYLQQRVQEELDRNLEIQKSHQEEMIRNAKFSSIGQMAAGITHEINTPLTYVKGNFEMLVEDIMPFVPEKMHEEIVHDAGIIKEGLERIESIITTMREASQKSNEKQEAINVYETIIASLILSHNRAKQIVRIVINDEVFHLGISKETCLCYAYAQKQRMEQVWIIILNNALDELVKIEDFNERKLMVTCKAEEESVVVTFWDNGGGIAPHILPKIFEPFESTKESSGIGIGLNIAYQIITQNGGTIEASNHEEGALFKVTLPRIARE